jgi:hypothetical protein
MLVEGADPPVYRGKPPLAEERIRPKAAARKDGIAVIADLQYVQPLVSPSGV